MSHHRFESISGVLDPFRISRGPRIQIYIEARPIPGHILTFHPPANPVNFFCDISNNNVGHQKDIFKRGNCYLIRPCIIRHDNSIMFPAQLIQTARAINSIKTVLARVSRHALINQDVGFLQDDNSWTVFHPGDTLFDV